MHKKMGSNTKNEIDDFKKKARIDNHMAIIVLHNKQFLGKLNLTKNNNMFREV